MPGAAPTVAEDYKATLAELGAASAAEGLATKLAAKCLTSTPPWCICTSSSHRRIGIAQQAEQLARHVRQVLGQPLHLAQPHMCVQELGCLGQFMS